MSKATKKVYEIQTTKEQRANAVEIPENTEINSISFKLSEKSKNSVTITRGELPLSEFAVRYSADTETEQGKAFNKQLDALKKAQAGILISKIDAGIALENICKLDKNGNALYSAGGYKSAEEFAASISMNKKTFSLWRCVARYVAPNGKKISALQKGLLSESAIFAAYASKIPIAFLNDTAETADHTIISAKDLFNEYNRFIRTIDTDEEIPERDENGKPITDEEKENAVDTTADTLELNGEKYHLFGVYGAGIKANSSIKVPENAMITSAELFKWSLENSVSLAKAAHIDVKKENNAKIVTAIVTAENVCIITLIQTTPTAKVITFMSCKTLSGEGIREKVEQKTEPETTEQENGNA